MSQLHDALESASIKILKYDPEKQRPVKTNTSTVSIEKFAKLLFERLGPKIASFPDVFLATQDLAKMEDMIAAYAEETGVITVPKEGVPLPPEMENLTLNMNLSAKGRDDKFFLTHPDETVSVYSGEIYLMLKRMDPLTAASIARKVVPQYMPRTPKGVSDLDLNGKQTTVFNMYTPPLWKKCKKWKTLPDKLPPLFEKLVNHLFPLKEEREYFFAWLHASMFSRAYVFLVLCGAPGTGKNRLKLVLRALHGHTNTVDGKKSTLTERFNSQLSESTLAWFDELEYRLDMENVMKELQNDSISIERKGVDATRATKIHASVVISNNKPRDNYIAFDARKFVPLVIRNKRLETSMTPEEIDELTKKVQDDASETFDIDFIAQIAKWVKRRGASKKWPNLEYHGPMFWSLAHTSMSKVQKKAVTILLAPENRNEKVGYDKTKDAFLWSSVEKFASKKNGDRSLLFPDYSTTKAFFEVFRDSTGRKTFETELIPGNNIMGDFWVKVLLKDTKIVTEASLMEQRGKENAKTKKEHYDL